MSRVCRICGGTLDDGEFGCLRCGSLLQRDDRAVKLECERHPEVDALAVCVVCGKPLCGDCAIVQEGVSFCDRDHARMRAGWPIVYTCASEFEADIILRNLEQASIRAVSFSLSDHVAAYWVHATPIVHVRVPADAALHAREILENLGLLDVPGVQ